jgi:hypothetical protein
MERTNILKNGDHHHHVDTTIEKKSEIGEG